MAQRKLIGKIGGSERYIVQVNDEQAYVANLDDGVRYKNTSIQALITYTYPWESVEPDEKLLSKIESLPMETKDDWIDVDDQGADDLSSIFPSTEGKPVMKPDGSGYLKFEDGSYITDEMFDDFD